MIFASYDCNHLPIFFIMLEEVMTGKISLQHRSLAIGD